MTERERTENALAAATLIWAIETAKELCSLYPTPEDTRTAIAAALTRARETHMRDCALAEQRFRDGLWEAVEIVKRQHGLGVLSVMQMSALVTKAIEEGGYGDKGTKTEAPK